MEERTVLSADEVEAIIQSAQQNSAGSVTDDQIDHTSTINLNALNVILENTRAMIENKISVLLRKKVNVKLKPYVVNKLDVYLKKDSDKFIYSSFKCSFDESMMIVCIEDSFLHLTTTLLYGGELNQLQETVNFSGKINLITAEKFSITLLECLSEASKEFGIISCEHYKSSYAVAHINDSITQDENVYYVEYNIVLDDKEVTISICLMEESLIKLIPVKTGNGRHREKDFWRTAIKSEVIDSYVTVNTTINDVTIKVKDFMNLKEGDEIAISDPTVVYVCLNNLKLFRALAGQSNSKIVAKIVAQI